MKIIVTSSTATDVGQIDPNDAALALLKKKLSAGSFVHLKQFSETQWGEVLSYGGGDFYSTNALLKLPDSWKNCPEKIPLQAKVKLTKGQINSYRIMMIHRFFSFRLLFLSLSVAMVDGLAGQNRFN